MTINADILAKAAKIKLAIFDVDGVLTNGQLYFHPNGDELKVFHVHDGLGLKLLQQSGVAVAIISSRTSAAVEQRLTALGVQHIYQGQADKRPAFDQLLTKLKLTTEQVAYTGDDLPDLPLLRSAGLGIAVANARPLLLQHAAWQTQASGGQGAVREICELIMQAQGTLANALKEF